MAEQMRELINQQIQLGHYVSAQSLIRLALIRRTNADEFCYYTAKYAELEVLSGKRETPPNDLELGGMDMIVDVLVHSREFDKAHMFVDAPFPKNYQDLNGIKDELKLRIGVAEDRSAEGQMNSKGILGRITHRNQNQMSIIFPHTALIFGGWLLGTDFNEARYKLALSMFKVGADIAREFGNDSSRLCLQSFAGKVEREINERFAQNVEAAERMANELLADEENRAEQARIREQKLLSKKEQQRKRDLKRQLEEDRLRGDQPGSAEAAAGGSNAGMESGSSTGSVPDTEEESVPSIDEAIRKVKGKSIMGLDDPTKSSDEKEVLPIPLEMVAELIKAQGITVDEFDVPFRVIMDASTSVVLDGPSDPSATPSSDTHKCYIGCTTTNGGQVKKSFVQAETSSHVNRLQELVDLCLEHESFLKVEQSVLHEGSTLLVSSEIVYSIRFFFQELLNSISSKTNENWWKAIKHIFWTVFRDVIRGLMHLFKEGTSCGDLVFNTFVTSKGRGRIIPSLEKKKKKKEDLNQLVDLMKSVITLPCGGDDVSFLPKELQSFFDLIKEADERLPVPAGFLIDSPYFWTAGEKVDFAFKFRSLVKNKAQVIEDHLRVLDMYEDWKTNLHGVYQRVLDEATARKLKPYKQRCDIARFIGAVYTHVNEHMYKADRRGKRMSDEEIESGLTKCFPNYYANIIKCLCTCVEDGYLNAKEVMDVSTIYFRELKPAQH